MPPVAVSAQMRRILRPRGRAVKRLPFTARGLAPHTLVRRLNAREVLPAPVKPVPAGPLSETVLADVVQPPPRPRWLAWLLGKVPWLPRATAIVAFIAFVLFVLAVVLQAPTPVWMLAVVVAAGLVYLLREMRRIERELAAPQMFKDGAQTPEMVAQAPKSPDFRLTTATETFRPGTGATDSAEGVRFKAAVTEMYAVDVAARAAAYVPPKQALDLARVGTGIVQTLNPAVSLPRLVLDRLVLPERFRPGFVAIDEIMNYPRFDLPMYKPLVDLNSDWFLPNLNLIEPDSITLLETNQKFIESYMVGLNHEMARELLWREYPTDQRGSYFRQFWDVSGYLPEAGENLATLAERLKDIPEIHTWTPQSALGDHDNRELNGENEAEVVLVIRGELLKRYPTAVIYAHKARWQLKDNGQINNQIERDLAVIPPGLEDNPPRTIVKTPLDSAKIEPDIYFFGFDSRPKRPRAATARIPATRTSRAGSSSSRSGPASRASASISVAPTPRRTPGATSRGKTSRPACPRAASCRSPTPRRPSTSRRPPTRRRPSSTRSWSSTGRTRKLPGAARPTRPISLTRSIRCRSWSPCTPTKC